MHMRPCNLTRAPTYRDTVAILRMVATRTVMDTDADTSRDHTNTAHDFTIGRIHQGPSPPSSAACSCVRKLCCDMNLCEVALP